MRISGAWLLAGLIATPACDHAPLDSRGAGDASPGDAGNAGGSAAATAGSSGSGGGAGHATTLGGDGGGGSGGTAGTGGGVAGSGGGAASGGDENGGAGSGGGANEPELPKRVLLYHFSTLSIASLPAQITFLRDQLEGWGYEVEESVAATDLSATNLERFGGVGMINTCFEPFGAGRSGEAETAALKAFVEAGGGLFGTHCASVTFQSAEPPHPYNAVIGGRGGHGFFEGKSACRTEEQHATTLLLPSTFEYTGNLDNADYLAPDSHVLVSCRWSGGDMRETAVSWYRTPGKGRVFYTNFAKEVQDLRDAAVGTQHILPGLGWVLGR
jgi:hypothetical protein